MTYAEAQRKLFRIGYGKSKTELEEIKKEYKAITAASTERELTENFGRLTSHPIAE